MTTPQLTHNLLPFLFARGYFEAVEQVYGRSAFSVEYQYGAQRSDPDNPQAGKTILNDMLVSVGYKPGQPHDLDYRYVRFMYEGMITIVPENPQRARGLTRRIGRWWWFGDRPISIGIDRYSLSTLLSPSILRALDTWKFGSPHISHANFKSERKLIMLALELLTNALQTQAQIACRLVSDEHRIVFTVQECPFCTAQSALCQIFVGVLEAFLIWLHGPHDAPSYLTLNEALSTDHTVVLDVI